LNWLFAGSLRSGMRAAAIMSLIQSARMNGRDSYAYLKDVLARLTTSTDASFRYQTNRILSLWSSDMLLSKGLEVDRQITG
jgi:hypothetical protein